MIPEVQRLLDLATDAMDRSEWASAAELSEVLALPYGGGASNVKDA
ncbi:MAG: hypothetical protein ACRDZ8_17745 [Acidimicrobiales bacterium]